MPFQTRLLSTHQLNNDSIDLSLFNSYNRQRYPYLLLSSASKQSNTQYNILIACPQYFLTLNSDKTLSCTNADLAISTGFFETLEKHYQHNKVDAPAGQDQSDSLPFTGGWFVYLSYEMAEEIEPCLSLPRLSATQPLAIAARCPAAIIFDNKNKQCLAMVETQYAYLLDEIEQDYKNIAGLYADSPYKSNSKTAIELERLVEEDSCRYVKQVEKIKQYIVEGDVFQANLSRQWQASLKSKVSDADLFRALSKRNPSSFSAMVSLQNMSIISSSPERLVSVKYTACCSSADKNAIVETRPIAGTRPRDNNKQNDQALAEELLAHPKEQAEHIMLIDLERNDLGRVCCPGSIEVNELMTLESWQHVHHIVSNVRGVLANGKSPIDVLRAVFPGGTITGCPKVRCIEILAELEQQARGAYTGSLGYINNDGSMDFNILIRTMVREGNKITFRAGGGIVNDSIAEKELAETRAKAKGLLKIFSLNKDQ